MPFDFAALEAARLARSGPDKPVTFRPDEPRKRNASFQRTDWAVGQLYDDGRFVPTKKRLSRLDAEAQAGRARDEASDAEVARMVVEGWTWASHAIKGNFKPGATPLRKGLAVRSQLKAGGICVGCGYNHNRRVMR